MEQEAEQAPGDGKGSPEAQTSETPDLTLTPPAQNATPAEQPAPEASAEHSETVPPTTTATAPPQPEVTPQSGEPQPPPVLPDRQSRVFALPDGYRGIGGDLCSGYGSLSRASLHSYWPAKNFQLGAHQTLPFLRDSYAPLGLGGQIEGDRLSERGDNPLDAKGDHPAASYPTLGGIHQFRPITTMELLREPSRTR